MRKKFVYTVLLIAGLACKEKYDLPYAGPSRGYLVVDGIINSGQGPTTIRLSRTLALVDSVGSRTELRAIVRVEGEDNSKFPLIESTGGIYSAPQLALNNSIKYRLYIRTTDGKEYISDYRNVIQAVRLRPDRPFASSRGGSRRNRCGDFPEGYSLLRVGS